MANPPNTDFALYQDALDKIDVIRNPKSEPNVRVIGAGLFIRALSDKTGAVFSRMLDPEKLLTDSQKICLKAGKQACKDAKLTIKTAQKIIEEVEKAEGATA